VNPTRCPTPVPFETLVAYWLDDGSVEELGGVEEHVFHCDECAQGLEIVAALGEAIRRLGQDGRLPGGLAPSILECLERDGRVIRRYRAGAGEHIHCTAGADDDLVVLELSADLADVGRVDLVHLGADGTVIRRVPRMPVIRGREVVWASSGDLIRSLPTAVMTVRLLAVDADGDRVVGEYTLHHTAFSP